MRKSGGDWFTAASTLTTSDGSFSVSWVPTEATEYEISAYHAGGEYTIETWSTNTIKIHVLNPNERLSRDLVPMAALIAIAAVVIGIMVVYRSRRY